MNTIICDGGFASESAVVVETLMMFPQIWQFFLLLPLTRGASESDIYIYIVYTVRSKYKTGYKFYSQIFALKNCPMY